MGERLKNTLQQGFTMAEMLIVLVIMAVLFGFVSIGVIQYQKDLKLTEMDNTAKEIFVAAQNHLSVMKVEGLLDGESDEERYLIYDGQDISVISNTAVQAEDEWDYVLPFGSIDNTVRLSGSYIIKYNPSQAIIVDVFYSDAYHFSEAAEFTTIDSVKTYTDALTNTIPSDNDEKKSERKNYNGAIIGFYGGAEGNAISINPLHEPTIHVLNGDQLKVEVSLHELDNDIDFNRYNVQLIISQGDKKAVLSTKIDAVNKKFTAVLDDVTNDNYTFAEQLKGFTLGDNITVQAILLPNQTTGSSEITSSARSQEVITNSLFADHTDTTNKNANIASFRHLMNLTKVSDWTNATQISDITWDNYLKNVNNKDFTYRPLELNDREFTYNGQFYRIGNLSVKDGENVGLFGNVTNTLTINNLVLDDFDLNGTNTGSLIGSIGTNANVNIFGVLARTYDDSKNIIGSQNAGGLVGVSNGVVNIQESSASTYVVSNNNAGGLVGSAQNITIINSYVGGHTSDGKYLEVDDSSTKGRFNVQSIKNAGGLIGVGTNVSLQNSFSTASVLGETVGSVAGSLTGGNLNSFYGSGLVKTHDETTGHEGPITGEDTNVDIQNEYDYIEQVYESSIAYPYDETLRQSPNNPGTTFTLPNVSILSGTQSSVWFIQSVYADWQKLEKENDTLYYVDYYLLQDENPYDTTTPYEDDPQVRNIVTIDNVRYNRVTYKQGESVFMPTRARTGYYIKSITYKLDDGYGNFGDTIYIYKNNSYYIKDNNNNEVPVEADKALNSIQANAKVYIEISEETVPEGYVMLKYVQEVKSSGTSNTGTFGLVKLSDENTITVPTYQFPNYILDGWYNSNKEDKTKYTVQQNIIHVGENTNTIYAYYNNNAVFHVTLSQVYGDNDSSSRLSGDLVEYAETGKTINRTFQLGTYANDTVRAIKIYENDVFTYYFENNQWKHVPNTSTKITNIDSTNHSIHVQSNEQWNIKVVFGGNQSTYQVNHIFSDTDSACAVSLKDHTVENPSALTFSEGKTCTVTENMNGVAGTLTTATALQNLEGFSVSGTIAVHTIQTENTPVIEIRYVRNEYTISYDLNSGRYYDAKTGITSGLKKSEIKKYGEPLGLLEEGDSFYLKGSRLGATAYIKEDDDWLIQSESDYLAKVDTLENAGTNTTMPAYNLQAIANWKENEIAGIRVEVFRQNSTDTVSPKDGIKTYSYYAGIDLAADGTNFKVGEIASLDTIFSLINGKEDMPKYFNQLRNRSDDPDRNYYSYNFFDFNRRKTNEMNEVVKSDGSTVVRLYYDLEEITIQFDYNGYPVPEGSNNKYEQVIYPTKTIHQATVTKQNVTNTIPVYTQDSNYQRGNNYIYIQDIEPVYYDSYYANYYYSDSNSLVSSRAEIVYLNSDNQYVKLSDSDPIGKQLYAIEYVSCSYGTYYPERTWSAKNGWYYQSRIAGKEIKDTNEIYRVSYTQESEEKYRIYWNSINFTVDYSKPGTLENNTYTQNLEQPTEENVYYINEEGYQLYKSSYNLYDSNPFESGAYQQSTVQYDLTSYQPVSWSDSKNALVQTITSDKVVWKGLYGENISDYENYKWDNNIGNAYWYYSNLTNTLVDELHTFDSDKLFVESNRSENDINIIRKSTDFSNNTINILYYLEDEQSERGNNLSIKSSYTFNETAAQSTTFRGVGSLTLKPNKFKGYTVLGYDYTYSIRGSSYSIPFKKTENDQIDFNTSSNYTYNVNMYYIRNNYSIFVKDSGNSPEYAYLYLDQLTKIDGMNITKPDTVDSDYTFAGLFDSMSDDATMIVSPDGYFVEEIGSIEDADGKTYYEQNGRLYRRMEDSGNHYTIDANNVQLFAHWNAPQYKLTIDGKQITVTKGQTLKQVIAEHSDEITTTKEEHEFVRWYAEEDGNKVTFTESAPILSDVTLTSEWKRVAGIGTYTIIAKDAFTGAQIMDDNDNPIMVEGTGTIGQPLTVNSTTIASKLSGYTVMGEKTLTNNALTDGYIFEFYFYQDSSSWNYEVTYQVNFGTDEDPLYATLDTETNNSLNDKVLVTSKEIEGYYLSGILENNQIMNDTYKIIEKPEDTSDTVQITFIYKPNLTDLFSIEGNSKVYDNTSCEATVKTIDENRIDDVDISFVNHVEYINASNNEVIDGLPIDAGSYKVHVWTDIVKGSKTITIWDSNDLTDTEQQYVNIFRRTIVLQSASQVFIYEDDNQVESDTYIVYYPGSDTFVEGQGIVIANNTTVSGLHTKDNVFTYSFKEGTKSSNYNIQRIFGKISITTEFSDEDKAINAEWSTTAKEKSINSDKVNHKN